MTQHLPDWAAERTEITRAALLEAQQERTVGLIRGEYTFATLRAGEAPLWVLDPRNISNLIESFNLYSTAHSAAKRIDDMIARNLLTYQAEAVTLLELAAPHLFGHEPINGPAPVDQLDAESLNAPRVITEEFCDLAQRYHRGGAICNAIEYHDNNHDGYADDAEAYRAGWNLSASAFLGADAAAAAKHYTARPGPERLAFSAGWIARQRVRAEAARRAVTFDRPPLIIADHDAQSVDRQEYDEEPTEEPSDHDLHGGAAGSFASEGCADCAALEEPTEDDLTSSDGVVCQKKAARRQ